MKHIVQGSSDFLKRYAVIFGAVWAERKSLDAPSRTPDEVAFLPAHLELTETPVSPASRWVMRSIIAFFCVALLWACIGELDIVAVAPGKTIVSSGTKVIQSAETAVVRRILVRDGQAVKQGDLLIELDSTATGADLTRAGEALVNARLATARLSALSMALDSGSPPSIDEVPGVPESRLAPERSLARSQFDTYRARSEGLQANIAQRQAELRTAEATIPPLEESAAIARSRSEDFKRLLENKYVGRHDYLLREQERITADRDLAMQRNRVQEIRSSLSSAEEELRVLIADMRQQTLDQLRQANEQVGQLTPEVFRTEQRDGLMALRAPVDGTVQQLAVHTVGGVVTPAQPLLSVVPSNEAVEVEVMILNKDIGFVVPGQYATIKIDSFPYTRFGYANGKLVSVSDDAIQDERLGLVFAGRVRIDGGLKMIGQEPRRLSPGMTLTAEIKTGRRRAIDYLLSPLNSAADESLTER
jgi:hemolysin D